MKRTFYKDGDGYIMATGKCPPAFKGVMFIVWEGLIDNLKEGVRSLDQLKKLKKVDDVNWEWLDAFAEAAGFDAKPARKDTPLDEFVGHCAAGTDPITAAVVSGLMDSTNDEPVIQVPDGYKDFHNVVVSICTLIACLLTTWFYLCL